MLLLVIISKIKKKKKKKKRYLNNVYIINKTNENIMNYELAVDLEYFNTIMVYELY